MRLQNYLEKKQNLKQLINASFGGPRKVSSDFIQNQKDSIVRRLLKLKFKSIYTTWLISIPVISLYFLHHIAHWSFPKTPPIGHKLN